MSELKQNEFCPECAEPNSVPNSVPALDRRGFIRVVGGSVASLAGVGMVRADTPTQPKAKPAEGLIQELASELTADQKKKILLPFESPMRLGTANGALQGVKINDVYSKAQQELVQKIVRSMLSGEEGFKTISRNGSWDSSGSFGNLGCHLFGDPTQDKRFACVITGHHLTLRCDSAVTDGIAWGGPIYYGHSVPGWAETNSYHFQTKKVSEVFAALDAKQKDTATIGGTPGEGLGSVKFRGVKDAKPGIAYADLNKEQQTLVTTTMRDILVPFRKEDVDEIMQIIKDNGGFEKLSFAFYKDAKANERERWHFWRVEGPGFVWNYRITPHVHCWVNIAKV